MKTAINLLPPSFRRQQILRKRAFQWASIISAVLVIGWGWHWHEMQEHRQLAQQLDTLMREHAPTQMMLKQLVEMRKQLKELEQQEAVAKELDSQRNALTLFGLISNSAKKTNGRLRVTKFEITNFQAGSSSGEPLAKPPGLKLNGVSLDNPSVTELLDGLSKSGVFRRVELLTLKESSEKNSTLRNYEVLCEF